MKLLSDYLLPNQIGYSSGGVKFALFGKVEKKIIDSPEMEVSL